jgi:hypothetical protein
MSARAHCQLNRRRRIVKADICDRHHLPVRAGDKRRQSALFFNGLLGKGFKPGDKLAKLIGGLTPSRSRKC